MHNRPSIVAVIADTHIDRVEDLPAGLLAALARADYIVHLGDFTSRELLDELRQLGGFHGIVGNHDDKLLHQDLKEMEVLEVGGKRLGLMHGLILPFGSHKRMNAWFKKYKIDALLYGHTHLATSKLVDGVLLFNPGSATGHFPASYSSFGLLTVDGSISGEIIRLEHPDVTRGLLLRLPTTVFYKALTWVETWPYVDFPYHMAKIKLSLEGVLFGLGFLSPGGR